MVSRLAILAMAAGSALVFSSVGEAQSAPSAQMEEQFAGTRLSFAPNPDLSNFTLRVTGPDGYAGQVFSPRVVPSFRLADHGSVPDGLYTYEITAATRERVRRASPMQASANGRAPGAGTGFVGMSQSGSFRVVNGRILELDRDAEEG